MPETLLDSSSVPFLKVAKAFEKRVWKMSEKLFKMKDNFEDFFGLL